MLTLIYAEIIEKELRIDSTVKVKFKLIKIYTKRHITEKNSDTTKSTTHAQTVMSCDILRICTRVGNGITFLNPTQHVSISGRQMSMTFQLRSV